MGEPEFAIFVFIVFFFYELARAVGEELHQSEWCVVTALARRLHFKGPVAAGTVTTVAGSGEGKNEDGVGATRRRDASQPSPFNR